MRYSFCHGFIRGNNILVNKLLMVTIIIINSFLYREKDVKTGTGVKMGISPKLTIGDT